MSSRPDESAPQASWWRRDLTARQVRILSIVLLIAMLAGFFTPLEQRSVGFVAFLSLFVFVFTLASHVAGNFPGWRGAITGDLDERQLAERAMAFCISYGITGGFLGIFYLWGFWSSHMLLAQSLNIDGWLLCCLFHLHLILPGTILAWRDAGTEPEDE